MSDTTNTNLMERAQEMIEYWEGSLHAKLIEQAIADNDLDNLQDYVQQAWNEMYELEYKPTQEGNDVV